MKAIHIRKRVLLTALAIVAAIAIYRIAFHVPAPAFNEEKTTQQLTERNTEL